MRTNIHHLVGWKLFCASCREGEGEFCLAATRRQLNRFYARYRLATHFEAVQARGYSEKALRGYAVGLRLLAAYSAAELLGEAIEDKVTSWEIPEPALATALRKILVRTFAHSNALFSDQKLRHKFQLFINGDNDVRIAATALRVMVAHGSFTPTGTESLTKTGANAIQRLSDVLLQSCEQRFGVWLESFLSVRPNASRDSL